MTTGFVQGLLSPIVQIIAFELEINYHFLPEVTFVPISNHFSFTISSRWTCDGNMKLVWCSLSYCNPSYANKLHVAAEEATKILVAFLKPRRAPVDNCRANECHFPQGEISMFSIDWFAKSSGAIVMLPDFYASYLGLSSFPSTIWLSWWL